MDNRKNLVVLLLFPILAITTGENHNIKNSDTLEFCKVPENNFPKGSLKLFVFGDSYLDTGNIPPARYSDRCILTDFIASSFGIHSPVIYKDRDLIENKSELRYGMNFALSGSGVFKEEKEIRNMTFQINNFKDQIEKKVYDKHDLENSIALVSNAGNDYNRYVKASDSLKGIEVFTRKVVDQLIKNVEEIHQLGVRKVAIFGAPPTGCWSLHNARPRIYCNESWNEVSRFHNSLLQKAVQNLNKGTLNDTFIYLDLYNPFMSVVNQKKGTPTYENPLIPCCDGVAEKKYCGLFDEDGTPLFTKCRNPELSVFWDLAHLSHNGSYAVYLNLIPYLGKLY